MGRGNDAHLFQQSTHTGEIPKEWSLANICPLFKKSDRSLACNYRPVSLTCVPCKLLKHIVCSNIMVHLDEYKLLSDRPHAFRKGHSVCVYSGLTSLSTIFQSYHDGRATENRIFAGPDRFLVCKTDSVCIKRIFFGPKKHTLRIIYWPNYLD